MEDNSCEVGRDSRLLGGNEKRKRISDSKDRTPSDRKTIKDATEKKHKNSREKGEKHSGSAVVVRGTDSCSESHRKPLQESKITRIHAPHPVGNPNNNIFTVSEEYDGKRSIDSAAHQNFVSERPAHAKKTKHTEASKIKDKKKHKSKCRKEGTCEMEKSGKPLELTKDTPRTKSRSKSESQPTKDKSHKKKETKSKDTTDAVKDEMDECSIQYYGELTEPEVKTLKKENNWQNIKGEPREEKADAASPTRKRKKDKGRSAKMGRVGTEDEKTLRKDREGKSSHKNKRKKDTVDADEPRKKKGKAGKESVIQKPDDEARLWKWWEEGQSLDGQKWKTLEHKGPLFPPEYESLPQIVSFYYKGKPVRLSPTAEEVATFYAKMLDHEYTTKEVFQKNFFTDWRMEMTDDERNLIRDLSKCDFREIHKYFVDKAEEKKALSKEEKKVLKEEANKQTEEYGYCLLDGHREKIGNFRVEPPGLFRGRGEHPKMGKLKRRVLPEDITINCSNESNIPVPPKGHRWKKVQHDNAVTWLASWVENVQGSIKYIMLNPSSKLKGEKDWQKYEIARKLKLKVAMIRRQYQTDWKSREMKKRQRGVAVYFIDKLALRAGNEKEEGESADTVGCCSLRVEHITLHEELDGQKWVVEFDFLGKDSIRYYNKVPVEKRVFKNLNLFMENKSPEDELFDRINTVYLNKTLNESMTGLSAKVFRTFNASTTLQEQLNKLTHADMSLEEKILSYNRANRAVAILCNHQRAAPKTFEKSMQLLQEKIAQKRKQVEEAKKELKDVQTQDRNYSTDKSRNMVEKKENAVKRLEEQLKKLLLQMTDREENKVIALGTSKLNYLDPRISVAWCKKFEVPVEKIYNKTQRDKFAWAIAMTQEDYQF